MKILETVRSWSFPPPAYEPRNNESPYNQPQRQSTGGSRWLLSNWILTFDKQWLLVHTLATFSCFALMFTGAALFVTTTFDNFDENRPAWLAGAVGMISLMVTLITFERLRRSYQLSHSHTLEQQKTTKFITTVCSVLGQGFVAAIQLAVAHSIPGSASLPGWSSRMQLARYAAQIAAVLCVVAAVYDVIKLCKDKSDEYADAWQDADLLEDAAERDDTDSGAVRLA